MISLGGSILNTVAFTLPDYLILRAAAQRYQEKHEAMLRQSSGPARKTILENIIDLDLAISRCNRRECTFTPAERGLLAEAVLFYRGVLPESSREAHRLIPGVLEKLAALGGEAHRKALREDGQCSVADLMREYVPAEGAWIMP